MKNVNPKMWLLLFTLIQVQIGRSQCTNANINNYEDIVDSNQGVIDRVLKKQYDNDWFSLIKHTDEMSSAEIQAIASYRNTLVSLLTCKVQDRVMNDEKSKRRELNYDDLTIVPLKQSFSGSEGLSSDIDVNLKGDGTEFAVEHINKEFKNLYHTKSEIGEVFDINFYAKDFVPALRKDQKVVKEGQQFYEKDDWREHIIKSEDVQQQDVEFQNMMAHVFMRKNMSSSDYVEMMQSSQGIPHRLKNKIEEEYSQYQSQLAKYKNSGGSQMNAENRLYEDMLEKAAVKRVQYLIDKKRGSINTDASYLDWKMAKTYSTLNANEAHCTAGAIVHVVANKQMLEDLYKKKRQSKRKLRLTKDELYQSFTEQVGFAFHKIDHSHTSGEFVNVGKYIHRMYNALKHFYAETGIDPIYTENERLAATDWEGAKKGRMRDASGKFTLDVEDKVEKLKSILLDFDKAFQRYALGSSMGNIEDLENLKSNLKVLLIHHKTAVDYQYYGR